MYRLQFQQKSKHMKVLQQTQVVFVLQVFSFFFL